MRDVDVLIVGAGAAGMMCAATAGARGRSVLLIDHADAPGKKIRISGGGRCNFTNLHTEPASYISANPRFAISALKRYRVADFIALVERYKIAYHEKTLGQLFCDGSAQQIIDMLLAEMGKAGVALELGAAVEAVKHSDDGFTVRLPNGPVRCRSLVIATGGKSIPKMGATGFAYKLAEQFEVPVIETRPGLVPLTFEPTMLEKLKPLAGIAVDARISCGKTAFREGMLVTHRGLSGPSILQISSYWTPGQAISIDLMPGRDAGEWIATERLERGGTPVSGALAALIPKRFGEMIAEEAGAKARLADLSKKAMVRLGDTLKGWTVKPVGSEGYRTAEVTVGGIDTRALDSATMAVKSVRGLFFIGEAVDVTGWLGGYNFQWAWASGWSAGQSV